MPDTGWTDGFQSVQDSTCYRGKHGRNSTVFDVDEQVAPGIFEGHVASIDRPLARKSRIRRVVPQILQWLTRQSVWRLEPGESCKVSIRGKILAHLVAEVQHAPVSLAKQQLRTSQAPRRDHHCP